MTTPSSAPADMVWIPGGTFLMGSDHHYPEEAPAHKVTVDGVWIDRHPVTNAEFARYVRKTGHLTVAEQAADPADYPGARPELLVPASTVFRAPPHRVDLANHFNWWTCVPGGRLAPPPGAGQLDQEEATTRWSTSPGPTSRPTPPGPARTCSPKPNGSSPPAAGTVNRAAIPAAPPRSPAR
jgi:formylglycine-generating enzyme required for sulfatase activity